MQKTKYTVYLRKESMHFHLFKCSFVQDSPADDPYIEFKKFHLTHWQLVGKFDKSFSIKGFRRWRSICPECNQQWRAEFHKKVAES